MHWRVYARAQYGAAYRGDRRGFCAGAAVDLLGDLVGRFYAEVRLGTEGRAAAEALTEHVRIAGRQLVASRSWLGTTGKQRADTHLATVRTSVGYPDTWLDWSGVELSPDNHAANVLRLRRLEFDRRLHTVGRMVDTDDWSMSPATTNAYYERSRHQAVITAAILQPPFFDTRQPTVVNFASVGSIIGHEFGHALIPSRDEEEARPVWLDDASSSAYEARVQCLIDAYDGTEMVGTTVDGHRTFGENQADIFGVRAAYLGYRLWLQAEGRDIATESSIPGLTDDQLYFVAYAQRECGVETRRAERRLANIDEHAPSALRVNAVLAQVPEFARAFACEAPAPMAPPRRCSLW